MKRLLPGYCSLLLLLSAASAFGQAAPVAPKDPAEATSKRLLRAQAAARAKKPADAEPVEPDPPGAQGALPTDMEKIAQATDVPFKAKPAGHLVKFNLQDADLAELVNHISGLTGSRFIYGAKVRQIKATVVSPEPVTLEEAYQAFLSILEANGMTVVPHGRFLKIVDSAGVATQADADLSRAASRSRTPIATSRGSTASSTFARRGRWRYSNKFKSKDGDITALPGRSPADHHRHRDPGAAHDPHHRGDRRRRRRAAHVDRAGSTTAPPRTWPSA